VTTRITVYTDGGCRPNPGPGGWGAVLVTPEGVRELAGSDPDSTNNRMELTAALRALEVLPPGSEVDLITDSTYLEQGITRWLAGWRRRGWMTAAREPVKNRDLWMALDAAARQHRVRWRWARGHAGEAGNERAHELAAAAIPRPAPGAFPAATATAVTATPPREPHAEAAEPPGPGASDDGAVEAFLGVAWSATRGEGAWGIVLRHRGVEKELAGKLALPSANAAHIASAAFALEALKRPLLVRVVTASDYLRDGATQWLAGWQQRGWRTREGGPVASREWWQRLARQLARLPVQWQLADKEQPPRELERARRLARAALSG
jgi:ribonuclease HI